jgi:hypothetical protein
LIVCQAIKDQIGIRILYALFSSEKYKKRVGLSRRFRESVSDRRTAKPTPLGVGCGTAIETCNSQSPLLLVVGIYPTLFI